MIKNFESFSGDSSKVDLLYDFFTSLDTDYNISVEISEEVKNSYIYTTNRPKIVKDRHYIVKLFFEKYPDPEFADYLIRMIRASEEYSNTWFYSFYFIGLMDTEYINSRKISDIKYAFYDKNNIPNNNLVDTMVPNIQGFNLTFKDMK
jgi:hypothetical protein